MNIVVITGSHHFAGTTAALADEFIRGAKEAGHEVFRFDSSFKKVHPCIACERCHEGLDGCVFKDDMEELMPQLLAADVVTFVTPIYYYDVTAQIKAVIDRFYAKDEELHKNKKSILITAMADDKAVSASGAKLSFELMSEFLEWEVAGVVNAENTWTKDSLADTDYLQQVYELGKSL